MKIEDIKLGEVYKISDTSMYKEHLVLVYDFSPTAPETIYVFVLDSVIGLTNILSLQAHEVS